MLSRSRTVRTVLLGLLLTCAGSAGGEEPKGPAKTPPKVGKLNVTRELVLDDKVGARGLNLTPQPGPQTITVTFTSSNGEVSVYVFPAAEVKAGDGLFTADAKKALAGKTGKTGTFTAEVAEKAEVIVVVRGEGKTTVELKLTNEVPDPRDVRIKKLEEENALLKKELAEVKQQLADLKKLTEKK
jgi:hypothetical protein